MIECLSLHLDFMSLGGFIKIKTLKYYKRNQNHIVFDLPIRIMQLWLNN